MQPETEIVSDAPVGRARRKAVKKATEACDKCASNFETDLESVEPGVVENSSGRSEEFFVERASEPVMRRLPAEEIRELVVEKLPLNPRLVLASFEEGGVKHVVRVVVGINRNFKVRMRLKAQRGADENAPWRLIGRRPRLPGRW